MDTWCRTTAVCASGRPSGPCMTRPETTNCACAVRAAPPLAPPPPPASVSSATKLGSELPEVFRIQVLEVGFQVVGTERPGARLGARLPRFDRGQRQQAFAREDRRFEAQRHGYRVRGSGVDLDEGVAAVDVQLGVVGVLL